jgi:hypothetical protein
MGIRKSHENQEVVLALFKGCEDALRTAVSFFQTAFSAQKNELKSKQCHQAGLVLLFRLLAIRYLEDRGVLLKSDDWFNTKSLQPFCTNGFESDLFDFDFDQFFFDHPIPESVMARIADSICLGRGQDVGFINLFDLGVEKIGDIYNHLLAFRIVEDEKKNWNLIYSNSVKKELGSYFTHPRLTHLLSESVGEYLEKHYPNKLDWLKIRICDNSCGSGHFLRQMIEDISYRLFVSEENASRKFADTVLDQNSFRRRLAQNCIFGIDKDVNAVWLTRLSLWLHTAEAGKPFVFLDHHILQGDAILSTIETPKVPEKEQLSFFGSNNESKKAKFSYASSFPEVFANQDKSLRGFDIVVGNPPWETVKPKAPEFYKYQTGAIKALPRRQLDQWIDYDKSRKLKYDRWVSDIKNYSAAIKDSGYQFQQGEVNTYSYFTERSMQILKKNGLLCYIVKLGLYGDEKTKGLRRHLFRDNHMEKMFIFKSNKMDGQKFFSQIDPNEKFLVFVNRKAGLNGFEKNQYEMRAKEISSLKDVNNIFESWQIYQVPDALDELNKATVFIEEKTKEVFDAVMKQPTIRRQGLVVGRELDQTLDRSVFSSKKTDIAIFTGSEVGHYTGKHATNWCKDKSVLRKYDVASKRLAVNNILPNSRRKLRCSELPKGQLSANSILTISGFKNDDEFYLTMAGLNSFIAEYYLRPSLSNLNLNNFRLYPLPIPTELANEVKAEIVKCAKEILKLSQFDERNESFKKVEALLAAGYGLSFEQIKTYLQFFEGVTEEYIQDVIDYAQIYRKKFKLR